jgi:hypothetical protein
LAEVVRPGVSGRRRGLWFAASSPSPAVLGAGCPSGGCPGVSELMSIFITTSMGLLSSTVAWWLGIPKKLEHARPGCSARLGSIRSARGASPTSSLAARTAGSTRRPHRALRGRGRPWLTRSTAFARCRPRVETAGARCNTRVARLGERASPPQWGHAAGLRRPLGRARLIAMSPSRRSSAHGCWKFRVTSKHIHCLGWGISVSTPLMA